jgi:hypothetical protein
VSVHSLSVRLRRIGDDREYLNRMQLWNGGHSDVAHVQEVSVHCQFVLDELEMCVST